jgi:MoaA/NifB/PqqE/SkfB family radical SAM enzyme
MSMMKMRRLVLRMDTTNLCNLRCRMCYYQANPARVRHEMTPELFESIARQAFPRTRFLYLSCQTEPLMNPHFDRFIELAGRYRVPFVSFCTNGVLMNRQVAQACIEARTSEIIFSVDGATPTTYEYIRRGARFEALLAALDLLRDAKAAASSTHPAARINFTCMERNLLELPAVVELAAAHGVGQVHVRHLLAFTREQEGFSCAEQMAYRRQFNVQAAAARRKAAQLGVELFLPAPVAQGTVAASSQVAARESNPYCILPWVSAIITPQGDYRLCSAYGSLGNLREQSFDDIYDGERLRAIRRGLMTRSPQACSWRCGQEAHDVSQWEDEPAQKTKATS